MPHGKCKTLYGLYKIFGRDEFLRIAKNYSDNVKDTIEGTLWEMEFRYIDEAHTITEAKKMIDDYNNGCLKRENVQTVKMEVTM